MTAVLDKQILTVEEHKDVQRDAQQLRELQDRVIAAQAHRADLVAEQQRLQRAEHEADVAAALGNAASVIFDPDRAPRLAQLDAEILRARTDEAVLRDALERLTVSATRGRERVQREINEQITASARAVIKKMLPLAEQLSALNQQLMTLAMRVPDGSVLVPAPQLLMMWLEQAGKLGGRG